MGSYWDFASVVNVLRTNEAHDQGSVEMHERPKRSSGPFILMLVFLCLAFGVNAIRLWQFGRRTRDWMPVEARVVERTEGSSGVGVNGDVTFLAYEVDGKEHRRRIEQILSEDTVTLYYDPTHPAEAGLKHGLDESRFGQSIAFGGLALLGALYYIRGGRLGIRD